jgi:hypothetical protein
MRQGRPMTTTLERLLAAAEHDMQAAASGRSLCRITASGAPARDVKYFEGSWAALRALTRAAADLSDEAAVTAEGERLLTQWQADLERWRTHEGSSWIPYCEGGVAGLTDYLREP